MLGLLGSYDSDDSGGEGQAAVGATSTSAPTAPAQRSPAVPAAASKSSVPAALPEAGPGGRHTSECDCEDCDALLVRFVAKSVQTKGIRFKCKLCSELVARKADAADHMQSSHSSKLQEFKQQKQPKLFEAAKKVVASAKKFSFAREDVLGKKRKIQDEDPSISFGGFEKKEKPELPPCMQEGYQDSMNSEVVTAPPWLNQPVPLSNDTEATDTEKVVDQHVYNAQAKRFTSRNVLEVKTGVSRCKLCRQTFTAVSATEKHIIEEHREDFEKEVRIWHRFLHTSSKRQPPFGWVCKICNLFFPTDNSTWRHLGKEVFIRREDKHLDNWKEKEDRWGHEEDGECCGDGMNSVGLSQESVQQFNDHFKKEEDQAAKKAAIENGLSDLKEDSGSEDSDEAAGDGKKKMIKEF